MITFVNADFRAAFPEFANTTTYPDAQINLWSALAIGQINACRWGTQALLGAYLYVAHEMTIQARDIQTANIGGTPGGMSGPVNSKTVGSVTAAYDTQQTAEKNAGYWNLTTYGKQFYRLMRQFGAGCIQL